MEALTLLKWDKALLTELKPSNVLILFTILKHLVRLTLILSKQSFADLSERHRNVKDDETFDLFIHTSKSAIILFDL